MGGKNCKKGRRDLAFNRLLAFGRDLEWQGGDEVAAMLFAALAVSGGAG